MGMPSSRLSSSGRNKHPPKAGSLESSLLGMLKRFRLQLLVLTAFTVLIFGLASQLAQAVDCNSSPAAAIQCGTDNAAGVPGTKQSPAKTINDTITNVINLISMAVGIAAVIMIMVGGFRYITSGGDQEGIKSAKNTIMYALIGLIVVALAQVIVRFVLNKTI